MEITEHQLIDMTRHVDDQHRAAMGTMPSEIRELQSASRTGALLEARRSTWASPAAKTLIAIGGAAIPLVAFARSAAAAGDGDIAAFAASVELAAVEAYKAAAASGKVTTKAVGDAATAFAGHHAEHAAAFAAAAGSMSTGKPNPKLLAAVAAQLQGATDEMAIVKIAFDLENAAAATYMFALGALTSAPALQLTASILPVEAQHAVVLGQVLGLSGAALVPPFETATATVDPAAFPAA
ncbi:MAG: ferritin-like domain-containing protein [Acidimicrobiia bacterium]